MAKRIVVCSDGTGNTSIKGRGTNVFKLFEAVDLNGHRVDPGLLPQIALYDDGVGTQNFKPLKIIGGATGFGLSRNVRQLYKELARVYDPGDEIYMFGFSRGAFTVRTLVGFIATCGLVDPSRIKTKTAKSLEETVEKAYKAYRACYRTALAELIWGTPTDIAARAGESFKREHSHSHNVRVRFLGVWDTVDAVGLPFRSGDVINTVFRRFKFPDLKLSLIVDRACQALAIDDERQSFAPLLWDESEEVNADRIEQVWFAGAHSNVGGGYPKQGMSLVAFDWMLKKASQGFQGEEGLRFNPDERRSYEQHANVDDKLYEPRSGLGTFYRWKIRDIERICGDRHVVPKLHVSVLERVAHGTEDYTPGNLPTGARVMVTPLDRLEHAQLASQRAMNVQRVINENSQRLLDAAKREIVVGRLSYVTFVASSIGVLMVGSGWTGGLGFRELGGAILAIGAHVGALFSQPLDTPIVMSRQLAQSPLLLIWLIAGFVITCMAHIYADRHMSRIFSEYWYRQQPKLREALKQARRDVVERQLTFSEAAAGFSGGSDQISAVAAPKAH